MDGPAHYRKAEKLLNETATSGPSITERDTWQQRQALVHAVLALTAVNAGAAGAWHDVLYPEPSGTPARQEPSMPLEGRVSGKQFPVE